MKYLKPYLFATMIVIPGVACRHSDCGGCKNEWQDRTVYYKGDIVSYHDTCWIAVTQGRGIIPGPWLENRNDIWVVCED